MSVIERIQAEIDSHPVVLFMKGTPQFPMCGFSSRTVQALKAAGAAELHTVNVLEEPEIRANLPRFSNWPTFPQLFINGELIGGCDITLELFESGELARMSARAQSAVSRRSRLADGSLAGRVVLICRCARRARQRRGAGLRARGRDGGPAGPHAAQAQPRSTTRSRPTGARAAAVSARPRGRLAGRLRATRASGSRREFGRLDGAAALRRRVPRPDPAAAHRPGRRSPAPMHVEPDRALVADPGLPAAAGAAPTMPRWCSPSTTPERVGQAYWGGYGLAHSAACRRWCACCTPNWPTRPVRVSGLQPGPMRTALRARAYVEETDRQARDPARYARRRACACWRPKAPRIAAPSGRPCRHAMRA